MVKKLNLEDKTILYVVPKQIDELNNAKISIVFGHDTHLVQRINGEITVLGTYKNIIFCQGEDYDLYLIKPSYSYNKKQEKDAQEGIIQREYTGKVNFLEQWIKAKK